MFEFNDNEPEIPPIPPPKGYRPRKQDPSTSTYLFDSADGASYGDEIDQQMFEEMASRR